MLTVVYMKHFGMAAHNVIPWNMRIGLEKYALCGCVSTSDVYQVELGYITDYEKPNYKLTSHFEYVVTSYGSRALQQQKIHPYI